MYWHSKIPYLVLRIKLSLNFLSKSLCQNRSFLILKCGLSALLLNTSKTNVLTNKIIIHSVRTLVFYKIKYVYDLVGGEAMHNYDPSQVAL